MRFRAASYSARGRPILKSGLSKIENGDRRVDVDDLVALAVALGVTPNTLLVDPEVDDARGALTPARETTRKIAWIWASGDESDPRDSHGDIPLRWYPDLPSEEIFEIIRPHDPPVVTVTATELQKHRELLDESWAQQRRITEAGEPEWLLRLVYGGRSLLVTDDRGRTLE